MHAYANSTRYRTGYVSLLLPYARLTRLAIRQKRNKNRVSFWSVNSRWSHRSRYYFNDETIVVRSEKRRKKKRNVRPSVARITPLRRGSTSIMTNGAHNNNMHRVTIAVAHVWIVTVLIRVRAQAITRDSRFIYFTLLSLYPFGDTHLGARTLLCTVYSCVFHVDLYDSDSRGSSALGSCVPLGEACLLVGVKRRIVFSSGRISKLRDVIFIYFR